MVKLPRMDVLSLLPYFDIQFSVALALDHIAERFIGDHVYFAGRVGGDVHVEQEIGFFLSLELIFHFATELGEYDVIGRSPFLAAARGYVYMAAVGPGGFAIDIDPHVVGGPSSVMLARPITLP